MIHQQEPDLVDLDESATLLCEELLGDELFVSEETVKTHGRRLMRKLGVRDRAHAVAVAFRGGLLS